MQILSISFHSETSVLNEWEKYFQNELTQLIENLMDVEHYILSVVESEYVDEGKNYNLLLSFESSDIRTFFLSNEFFNLEEHINKKFGSKVMLFSSLLNPYQFRLNP